MPFSWCFTMGHADVCVHVFAPDFKHKIEQLLNSLSLGVGFQPISKESIHLVLMTPATPEWFPKSIGVPELRKLINATRFFSRKTNSFQAVEENEDNWYDSNLKLYSFRKKKHHLFLTYLSEKENKLEIVLKRISDYIYFISTYWHSTNDGLLLHSAAVDFNGHGYLFLGEGGAGKSTAVSLGISSGVKILSDDLVFIINHYKSRYKLAAAPGPTSKLTMTPQLHPQLRGIFRLVQDSHDSLIPLSSLSLAHAIFRSFEWSHWIDHLPLSTIYQAFHTSCNIARQTQGFELHFRKTPDFWKLIDAQFSN